jgi:hypothetical protein
VPFTVGFADGYIAGESEAEALAEEGCESEIIVAGVASRFGRDELCSSALCIGRHDVTELERKLKESTVCRQAKALDAIAILLRVRSQ